jgi:hypothetical protein
VADVSLLCVRAAVLLGVLYWQLSMSGIGAVQSRMGLFMLECMFISFTSVSALPVSHKEDGDDDENWNAMMMI